MEIRDPVHGAIEITPQERTIIDHLRVVGGSPDQVNAYPVKISSSQVIYFDCIVRNSYSMV